MFLEAAARSLSQDLGHPGARRHELGRLDATAFPAQGRSRRGDLVELLKAQPALNSAMVIDRLGVTRGTALSLICGLVHAGCLVNLAARRTAHFRALPSLAARMSPAGGAGRGRRPERPLAPAPERQESPGAEDRPRQWRTQSDKDRLARIRAELDAAMDGTDRLLKDKP